MVDVFLSYSATDSATADRLARDLQNEGVDVWYDRRLVPGENLTRAISSALAAAKVVLVLVSRSSLKSEWVTTEWSSAIARSSLVVPVFLNDVTTSEVPGVLRSIQGIFLDGSPASYRSAVAAVVDTVRRSGGSAAPRPSEVVDTDQLVEDITSRVLARLNVEKSVAVNPDGTDQELVFVITSFQKDMEPAFDAVRLAAKAVGLRAERVKDVRGDYRITDQILTMIRRARFVVADLTYERPNVYFELGYARGLAKTVVTIVREGTKVHFDVQGWTYMPYIDSRPLEKELIERFQFELEHS